MRPIRTMLIALLILGSGCTSNLANKKDPENCSAGGAACHGALEQTKGGQNIGGGMGRGAGGMGGGM